MIKADVKFSYFIDKPFKIGYHEVVMEVWQNRVSMQIFLTTLRG